MKNQEFDKKASAIFLFGSMEATLLQSINVRKGKVLGVHLELQHSGELLYFDWDKEGMQRVNELIKLPPGAYKIVMPYHMMGWVKVSDELGYFFEPNDGIWELQGDLANTLFNILSFTRSWLAPVQGSDPDCLFVFRMTERP